MENAVDALKIAFAVMVLVLALTVSIVSFNKAKATSDVILYTKDETNYYEYQGAIGKASENRIVGLETVIPTLYRYYKENYTVVFKQGNYNTDSGEFSNIEYLYIYESVSNAKLWEDSYSGKEENSLMNKKYGITIENDKRIFSFDLDEEILRHEPWTGSTDKIKSNLDAFLNGSVYISPVNNKDYKNYSQDRYLTRGGFIEKYKNRKFIETVGEYTYSSNTNNSNGKESELGSLTKDKTKRVITFTLIK